jgi:type IV pilus assembly protein PilA
MAAEQQRPGSRDGGFTLIELLVVVIIVGILAAIAIPVFLNQREKAWDAAVKSELRNAAAAQVDYLSSFEEGGSYADSLALLVPVAKFRPSATVVFDAFEGDSERFCMVAHYDERMRYWRFDSDVAVPERIPAAAGACPTL